MTFLRKRLVSFAMVIVIALLLLATLVLSAAVSVLGEMASGFLPVAPWMLRVAQVAASLLVLTVLFALMFKILPDVQIRWSDVWTGAVVTSLLFTLGIYLISLYIGRSAVGSTYGAAGSLVILLLWIYYSSMILFFGSEFTQVYASREGSQVVPDEDAMAVTKPLPIEGRPNLEPTAAKGAVPASGAYGSSQDRPVVQGDASGDGARASGSGREVGRAIPAGRMSGNGGKTITPARASGKERRPELSIPAGRISRFRVPKSLKSWGLGRSGSGAAALALSLALVTAVGALRRLATILRHPRHV
jgi:hypothetical protein